MTFLVTAFAAYFKEGLSILYFHFKKDSIGGLSDILQLKIILLLINEVFPSQFIVLRLHFTIQEMYKGHKDHF